MVRRIVSLASSTALLASLAGCGLIFNGTHQKITVQSTPQSAKVTSNPATAVITTPGTVSFERKHNYSLTFERAGYSPATFEIRNRMQYGTLVLDIFFTGLIGVIVDATTGGWKTLYPTTAMVHLTKLAGVTGPDTITVGIRVGKEGDKERMRVESSVPGVLMRVETN